MHVVGSLPDMHVVGSTDDSITVSTSSSPSPTTTTTYTTTSLSSLSPPPSAPLLSCLLSHFLDKSNESASLWSALTLSLLKSALLSLPHHPPATLAPAFSFIHQSLSSLPSLPLHPLFSSHSFPHSTPNAPPPPVGLANPGNTCYVNTILTALSPLPLLPSLHSLRPEHPLTAVLTELTYAEGPVEGGTYYESLEGEGVNLSNQASGPFSVTVPGDCREFYMNLIPTLPPNLRKFFTGTMTNTTTDAAGVSRVDASSVSFVTVPLAGSGRVEFGTVCGKVCKGTWTIEVEGGSVERESCFRGGSVVAVHFQRVGGSAAGAVGCELPVVYEMQGGESDSQVYDLMSFVVRGEDGGEEDQHVYCVVKKEGVWWKVSDESTMKIDLEEIYWEGLVMAFYWDGSLPEGGANLPAPPCSLHATARNNMLRSRKWATLCPPYGDLLIRLLSHSVDAMKLGLDGSTAVGRRVCVVWKNGDYTGTIVKFDANANRFHVRYDVDDTVKEYKLHKKEFTFVDDGGAPQAVVARVRARIEKPVKLFRKVAARQYNEAVRVTNLVSVRTHLTAGAMLSLNGGVNVLQQLPGVCDVVEGACHWNVKEASDELAEVTRELLAIAEAVDSPATKAALNERVALGERVVRTVVEEGVGQEWKVAALQAMQASNKGIEKLEEEEERSY